MTKEHKKAFRVEKTYWDMTPEEQYAYIKGSLQGFSPNEEVRARAKQPLSKDADLQSVSDPEARSSRRRFRRAVWRGIGGNRRS